MAGEALAANITWLTELLAGEEDASRRSEAETLLNVASKLTKQPSKTVLRQIAKELQVHQKDRRMNEIYDAALARVGDRVDELRKQSQERRSKRPRNEAVAVSGFVSSSSDAKQFAVDDRSLQPRIDMILRQLSWMRRQMVDLRLDISEQVLLEEKV